MISARSNRSGFTLLEVVVAIGILAISLVAIFEMQGGNIETAMRTRDITVATLLARSKMIDIEQELFEEGFTDFEESMSGTFEDEGWPEFSWEADLTKVEIPIPDSFPGADENPNAALMMGSASFITDLIKNALRECALTVTWDVGGDPRELMVTTHFIDLTKATLLESTSSSRSSAAKNTTGSTTSTSTSTTTSK